MSEKMTTQTIENVLNNPVTSGWLKHSLKLALTRDWLRCWRREPPNFYGKQGMVQDNGALPRLANVWLQRAGACRSQTFFVLPFLMVA